MFTTVTSPVASHSANSSSGPGDAARSPATAARRRARPAASSSGSPAPGTARARPPRSPSSRGCRSSRAARRAGRSCGPARRRSRAVPRSGRPPEIDARRRRRSPPTPRPGRRRRGPSPRTCSASAPSSASLATCTGILSTDAEPARPARRRASRGSAPRAPARRRGARRRAPRHPRACGTSASSSAEQLGRLGDVGDHLAGQCGCRGAGSSCAVRGSARRARRPPSRPGRPARRPSSTTAACGSGSTISDGRPGAGAPGRHGLGDDAGLGQPVDHRLDRAAVEPELGGQRRPRARARRRAAGAAAPPGCAAGPRRAGPAVPVATALPRVPVRRAGPMAHRPATADRRRDSTSTPAASSRTSAVDQEHHRRPAARAGPGRCSTVASTAPPMTALLTRPRPPNSDVPPITAAPTANSSVLPPPALGRDRADLRRVDDRADRRERRGDHEHRRRGCATTLMPARRAASRLPPTA